MRLLLPPTAGLVAAWVGAAEQFGAGCREKHACQPYPNARLAASSMVRLASLGITLASATQLYPAGVRWQCCWSSWEAHNLLEGGRGGKAARSVPCVELLGCEVLQARTDPARWDACAGSAPLEMRHTNQVVSVCAGCREVLFCVLSCVVLLVDAALQQPDASQLVAAAMAAGQQQPLLSVVHCCPDQGHCVRLLSTSSSANGTLGDCAPWLFRCVGQWMLCVAAQFHVNAPSSCPLSALLQGNRCVWQGDQVPAACASTGRYACCEYVLHTACIALAASYRAKRPMGEVRFSAPGTLPVYPSAAAEQGMQPPCCLSAFPTPGFASVCPWSPHSAASTVATQAHSAASLPCCLHVQRACVAGGLTLLPNTGCCIGMPGPLCHCGCAVVGPQLPTQQTVRQGQGAGGGVPLVCIPACKGAILSTSAGLI